MTGSVLATVLFTDIVGSSDHSARLGDTRWGALLEEHHRLVRTELDRFGGRELDTAGDGFFASFEAPGRAVRCAAAIVAGVRVLDISVRAGVHTGECEVVGDKLGGVAVHLGARISAEAGPAQVLVSSTVRDLLAGSGVGFEDRGLHALKGIPGEWRLYAVDARTLEAPAHPGHIQLCGKLIVELDGRRVEDQLPGRQGRVLFAYLATNRLRPIARDDMIEALWPGETPTGADTSLSALLSKLRRALGSARLEGRTTMQLQLPAGTVVDLEAASEALHRAESAVAKDEWAEAWGAARVPLHVAPRPFLPGDDAPWIDDVRRQLDEMYVRALEITAEAGLGLGGSEIDTAERSARSLVRASPFRETGYRYLMSALDARGNRAEALRVYEELRTLLREELGAAPADATQDLHRVLLGA